MQVVMQLSKVGIASFCYRWYNYLDIRGKTLESVKIYRRSMWT
jgi:hypothetical protein